MRVTNSTREEQRYDGSQSHALPARARWLTCLIGGILSGTVRSSSFPCLSLSHLLSSPLQAERRCGVTPTVPGSVWHLESMGNCLWQIDNISPLSHSPPPPRRRQSGLGQLLGGSYGVCHCPDYHHSWGRPLRSRGSLSEPHLSSLCLPFFSLCVCPSVMLEREPWDCCARPLPRTMPGSRCAMHSCQPTHRSK